MKSPILHRQSIPFFYDKSEAEFQQDSYERFDPMVFRQSALHFADELWGKYPLQPLFDFAKSHLPSNSENITELGCSTGRWIASLAKEYSSANCWGIDYSYQMLKRAEEYWCAEKTIYLDASRMGFPRTLELKGHKITNLQFGLAKAGDLPFDQESQDLLLHSFLLDRVDEPANALREMHRVLRKRGTMIFITPLNFVKGHHWARYYPAIKIYKLMEEIGFEILDWQEGIELIEPLDMRGNGVKWNCIGVAATKR